MIDDAAALLSARYLSPAGLAARGLTPHEIRRLVSCGALIRLRNGRYVSDGCPPALAAAGRAGGRLDCVSLLAALGQAFLAARTSLDERVFAQWGRHWQRDPSAADRGRAAFDGALHDQFGKQTTPRTLDARIQAAFRLLQLQAFACAGQLFLLGLSIALNLRGIQS